MMNKRIVIVDDDFLIAEHLRRICVDAGATVCGMAHNASNAVEMIENEKPEFVLMDVRLGEARDGVDVSLEVNKTCPDMKIIFITGSSDPKTVQRINEDHPYKIMFKPIDPSALEGLLAA